MQPIRLHSAAPPPPIGVELLRSSELFSELLNAPLPTSPIEELFRRRQPIKAPEKEPPPPNAAELFEITQLKTMVAWDSHHIPPPAPSCSYSRLTLLAP